MPLRLLLLAIAPVTLGAQAPPTPVLTAGTRLVYASGGSETPWTIDSIVRTRVGNMSDCVQLSLRLSPAAPQTRRGFCVDSQMVYSWTDSAARPRASRPLRGDLESRSANGHVTTYTTGVAATETISGFPLIVIPTIVTTRDSTGRIVRRLRERFSVALLSATGGVFEVPDSAGGWRTERTFELVRIEPGAVATPSTAPVRNTMLRWHPAIGLHMGGPSRVSIAFGGYRVTRAGDTNAGYTVLLEPGLDAAALRLGYTKLAPFFTGGAVEASALRTWHKPTGASANTTYLGAGGRLVFFGFNFGVAAYAPLNRDGGDRPFVAATGGLGF